MATECHEFVPSNTEWNLDQNVFLNVKTWKMSCVSSKGKISVKQLSTGANARNLAATDQ